MSSRDANPDADVLDHESIVALIRAAQAGDEAAARIETGGASMLLLQRAELQATVRFGVAARNRVIEANMRLVTKIAHPMALAAGRMSDLEDLRQAGVMGPRGTSGLVRAIALFDPSRGKRFTTYATPWIRVAVRDAIDEMNGMTLRGGARVRSDRVREIASKLAVELERRPTEREIKARCVLLGVEAPTDRALVRVEAARQPTVEHDPDMIADSRDLGAELETADLTRHAYAALRTLPPLEARAIVLAFGLDGDEPLTFEQLGEALGGKGRDASRKLVAKALRRIKRAMLGGSGRARIDSRASSV